MAASELSAPIMNMSEGFAMVNAGCMVTNARESANNDFTRKFLYL